MGAVSELKGEQIEREAEAAMGQKNTISHGEEKLHPKTLYVHAKAAQQQREAIKTNKKKR